MNKSTILLAKVLGLFVGIMGIEHGIGELVQGSEPTKELLILSWPNTQFFSIMAGEPAMTVLPNYTLAGIFSIVFSTLFALVLFKVFLQNHTILIMFIILLLMILSGAGFGPPILGIIVTSILFKTDSSLLLWKKIPKTINSILAAFWPYSFSLCLLGWLMLFPGAAIINYFLKVENDLLMIVPIIVAFGMIPVTLLTGFSKDIEKSKMG